MIKSILTDLIHNEKIREFLGKKITNSQNLVNSGFNLPKKANLHVCHQCAVVFELEKDLVAHFKELHPNLEPYDCAFCYKPNTSVIQRSAKNFNKGKFRSTFPSFESYTDHMFKEHKDRIPREKENQQESNKIVQQSDEKGLIIVHKNPFNRLKIKELTTKFHYCRHCGIDFSCDKHLQAHFKESHFNTKYRKDRDPYIDYHCKKYENGPFLGFSTLLSYEEHMFAEHKIIMPAEKSSLTKKVKLTSHDCRFCENIHFKSEEDLQKHFKGLPILHKNNSAYDRNPYRCEIGHSEN